MKATACNLLAYKKIAKKTPNKSTSHAANFPIAQPDGYMHTMTA